MQRRANPQSNATLARVLYKSPSRPTFVQLSVHLTSPHLTSIPYRYHHHHYHCLHNLTLQHTNRAGQNVCPCLVAPVPPGQALPDTLPLHDHPRNPQSDHRDLHHSRRGSTSWVICGTGHKGIPSCHNVRGENGWY